MGPSELSFGVILEVKDPKKEMMQSPYGQGDNVLFLYTPFPFSRPKKSSSRD